MNKSHLTHLRILAIDNIYLPALHFTGNEPSDVIVLYTHGAGSSSVIRHPDFTNELAAACRRGGVDFLAFNNRGAGYITKFDVEGGGSIVAGMTYELINDFRKDIGGVITWARQAGYKKMILAGSSTGANKIVHAVQNLGDDIVGIVLLSGGDDITLQTSRYQPAQLLEARIMCSEKVSNGDGAKLVPRELFAGDHPISWQSLEELITENSDYDVFPFARYDKNRALFHRLAHIRRPTLFVYGSNDFGTVVPVNKAFAILDEVVPTSQKSCIEHADHSFTSAEKEVGACVLAWMCEIGAAHV